MRLLTNYEVQTTHGGNTQASLTCLASTMIFISGCTTSMLLCANAAILGAMSCVLLATSALGFLSLYM